MNAKAVLASSDKPQKSWLRKTVTTTVIVGVCAFGLLAFAEYHTSQPGFCGRCHIMQPYYDSWEADVHGASKGVKCVDCHYAPGEKTTIKAKLRGLSQAASYISGRYGATRPRAHVSNDSCMLARCHGDGRFLDREIKVGTVLFTHASHLKINQGKRDEFEKEHQELAASLKESLGAEHFAELTEVAKHADLFVPRVDKMEALVRSWKVDVKREDLERLTQFEHRPVRWEQLDDLQCTSCHTYASRDTNAEHPQKSAHHFRVAKTSCYTCHFNNEGFNTGTNTCLTCHTLPTKDIVVHKELTEKETSRIETPELGKQTVKMNHQMILDRKVNCVTCHADVAGADSQVLRRDCEQCHDQPKYLEKFQLPLNVETVAEYHRVHVPQQRAKCLDCHSEIHHQLTRTEDTAGTPGFLATVMSDCKRCHPNQHAEQISLLRGEGGLGVPKSSPNTMFGSRTNCYGCHTEMATNAHGGLVNKATQNGCVACHGDRHGETFEKWKAGVELTLNESVENYQTARKLLDEATEIPDEAKQKATDLLTDANTDLRLVQVGNGMHNMMYAIELLDAVNTKCEQATAVIKSARAAAPKKVEKPADDQADAKPDAKPEDPAEEKPEAKADEKPDSPKESKPDEKPADEKPANEKPAEKPDPAAGDAGGAKPEVEPKLT